ncbi:MAG: sulfite exporter TauE/SafE family protein [Candidatus Rokuibacteriota bacterium]
MTALELTLVLGVASAAAGFLGSLTGLGGGVVIVPLLTLGLGVDLRYAIGASLVSVIATSSAAGAVYVEDGYSNIRVGMLLEVGTTLGAVGGALLATVLPVSITAIVFGGVLLGSAYLSLRRGTQAEPETSADALATRLHMDSSYPTPAGPHTYHVTRVPQGCAVMFVAGSVSGLLGIGSGALKVLALDQIMRLPFKVSTATSNFMIGVTAAASAGFYLSRGYIDPALSMPVMLGVVAGASLGSRVLVAAKPENLRRLFVIVLIALGLQMIYHGLAGYF